MAYISQEEEPCFVISVVAKLVQLHPQTLRYYDRIGLIRPSRTSGRIRLYSQRDVEELRRIVRLTDDLGVNLAGVEVIMNMTRRMQQMQEEMEALQSRAEQEINYLRQRLAALEGNKLPSHPVINASTRELGGSEEDQR